MLTKSLLATTIAVLLTVGLTACVETKNNTKEPETLVKEFHEKWSNAEGFNGEVKIANIKKTDSENYYLMEMENGGSGYITSDGKYLIGGPILALKDNKIVELGDKVKSEEAKNQLKKIDLETTAITYKPEGETKHTLYVFTDPTCSACRLFHNETAELLKNGVQIHYLPWIRNSESKKTINDVWCAKDKKVAHESAIKSEPFVSEKCENSVEKSIQVGTQLGVKATPTIYTEDGRVIAGALPAQHLLQILNPTKKDKAPSKESAVENPASEPKQ